MDIVLARWKGGGIVLAIAAVIVAAVGVQSRAQASGDRLVLAFYYAWYDQKTWNSGKVPDVPAEPYASANRDAIARHVDQAKGAGIDALVLNWWGKGNPTEKNLKTLLDVAAEKGFKVAVDFDINSPFMSPGTYAEHLAHLHSVHANHSAYLRWQGRPVVFFYNVARIPVGTWRNLRDSVDPNHTALWIAEGTDLSYQSVFDGHHLYSIAWRNNVPPAQTLPKWGDRVRKYNQEHGAAKVWVATVMPGYDDRKARGGGFVVGRNGGEYYRACWQAAIASRPQWVIVNSFNEWPEGTYVEPSRAYGSAYLDLTREWAARFKGADLAAAPIPEAPAQAKKPTPPPTANPRPSPTPVPTPTPLPPRPFLPYEPATASSYLALHCGYLLIDLGAGPMWAVLCPPYILPADAPHLMQ
ncbi:MAG: glycoside hydrolase family 99-like domain-containing protein [Anaerolineae bacterium]|nr:glycoside hydrolase family 99-like domain-containing protein [Anaerolineae bacterium]